MNTGSQRQNSQSLLTRIPIRNTTAPCRLPRSAVRRPRNICVIFHPPMCRRRSRDDEGAVPQRNGPTSMPRRSKSSAVASRSFRAANSRLFAGFRSRDRVNRPSRWGILTRGAANFRCCLGSALCRPRGICAISDDLQSEQCSHHHGRGCEHCQLDVAQSGL